MDLTGLTFDDVLLKPQRGVLMSRKQASLFVPSLNLGIPLIAAPMPSVASPELIKEITRLGGMGVVHRMNRDEHEIMADYYNSAPADPPVAIGLHLSQFDRLYEMGVRSFVLDVAHAHTDVALNNIKYMRDNYDDFFLIAGNVATAEGAYDLAEAGADAIKVGIGPGSVCTTRQVTGFGVPQLQAIQECAEVAHRLQQSVSVIADGGIRNSGDIVKALASGADAVMIGSLFACASEAPSPRMHYGNASAHVNGHNAPEGLNPTMLDNPIEPLETIVKRLTWGIRSGISYAGATSVTELQEAPEWIRLSDAGRRESKLA